MTNIVASLLITLQTNWVSQTKTVPFCNQGDTCRLQHMQLVKQLGTVQTNYTAEIIFEGRAIAVTLKSEEEKLPSKQREITEVINLHNSIFINGIGNLIIKQ